MKSISLNKEGLPLKVKIIILLLFFLAYQTQAQSVRFGQYKWKYTTLMTPCNDTGTPTDEAKILSEIGQQFKVVQITNSSELIIVILDYTKIENDTVKPYFPKFYKYNYNDSNTKKYRTLSFYEMNGRNYGNAQRYFKISQSDLDEAAILDEKISTALSAGILNFPFKLRLFPKVDFSGSYNIGAAVGIKFGYKSWRQFHHSLIVGLGISSIILDSASTHRNQNLLSSNNNFTSSTIAIGYLIEYQNVQIGIFSGFDILNRLNHNKYQWDYQGVPWLSIGLGYSIFSIENKKPGKIDGVEQKSIKG